MQFFVVIASQSMTKGLEVKTALVRELDHDPDWNGDIPGCEYYYDSIIAINPNNNTLCANTILCWK